MRLRTLPLVEQQPNYTHFKMANDELLYRAIWNCMNAARKDEGGKISGIIAEDLELLIVQNEDDFDRGKGKYILRNYIKQHLNP